MSPSLLLALLEYQQGDPEDYAKAYNNWTGNPEGLMTGPPSLQQEIALARLYEILHHDLWPKPGHEPEWQKPQGQEPEMSNLLGTVLARIMTGDPAGAQEHARTLRDMMRKLMIARFEELRRNFPPAGQTAG